MSAKVRTALGVAVLLCLAGFAALLLPAYWRNWQFQQYLHDAVGAPPAAAAGLLRAQVRDRAARIGVPLRAEDLKVERGSDGNWRIDALYVVRVDLFFYTVDLHFRPRAG